MPSSDGGPKWALRVIDGAVKPAFAVFGGLALLLSPWPWFGFVLALVAAFMAVASGTDRALYPRRRRRSVSAAFTLAFVVAALGGLMLVSDSVSAATTNTVNADGAGPTSVHAVNNSDFFACYRSTGDAGNDLNISQSTDGGASWTDSRVGTATTADWSQGKGHNICYVHADGMGNVIVAYGNETNDNLYAAVSPDNGTSWTTTEVASSGTADATGDNWAHIFNATHAYVVGSLRGTGATTQFCETSDGGGSWACTEIVADAGPFLRASLIDTDTIHVVTDTDLEDMRVYKSSDGGSTWAGTLITTANPQALAYDAKDENLQIALRMDTFTSPDRFVLLCTDDGWATTENCGVWDLSGDGSGGGSAGAPEIRTSAGGNWYFAYKDNVDGTARVAERTAGTAMGDRSWVGNTTLNSCGPGSGCTGLGLGVFGSDGWVSSYEFQGTGGGVFVTSEGASQADLEVTGFNEARDVRTDYSNDPLIFVRSDSSDQPTGQIAQFNKLLSSRTNRDQCPQASLTPGAGDFGLSVTFDGFLVWACEKLDPVGSAVAFAPSISSSATFRTTDCAVAFEALESETLNNVAAGCTASPTEEITRLNMGLEGSVVQWDRSFDALQHITTDRGTAENLTWGVSNELGVRAFDSQGLRVATASSVLGLSIGVHNGTVYVGNATSIGKYDRSVDVLTLNTSVSEGTRVGGLRLSKDGQFVLAWQGSEFRVHNATDLGQIVSIDVGDAIRACDMDVRNNRVYCVTQDTLTGWEVFDSTSSLAGEGTAGSENPALDGPLSEGGQFGSVSTTTAPTVTPEDPGLFDVEGLVPHFGSEGAARAFLGLFIVLAFAAGFALLGSEVGKGGTTMPILGALGGFLAAVQFGLFPAWVVMLLVIVLVAAIIARGTIGGS